MPGGRGWGDRPAELKTEPDVASSTFTSQDERRGAYQSHQKSGLHTQVIVLSSFCEDEEIIAAIDAGALSYLLKDSAPEKLLAAVKAARRGEPVLHPRIVKKLMQRVSRKESPVEPLTAKEKEVLGELVKGKSNKEIAAGLFISETTVKTHISNILQKLQVKDRTQAVIKALEMKLV